MNIDEQIALLRKGTVDCIPEDELRRKLERSAKTGKPLRVKAGFDPTAPDIHLGHTVLIRKMRHFQQLCHTVIFLIGDFTGMIGDPSGRSATRPALTREQIDENAETYKQQIFKLLDRERTEIRFNNEWFSKFGADDFIRLTGKATVAQILEREDFKKRFQAQAPISLHELLYALAQGYDSVALEADVELGGTDQKFNLLMARQIQQAYGVKEPQLIMTTPLLEGLDGVQKMSKSLGNYIGITEPPRDIFGKVMSISDGLMWRYYELLTDMSTGEIAELKAASDRGERHPRDLKVELARRIVADFHSEAEAQEASREFDRLFRERETPADIPTIDKPAAAIKLVKLLASEGLATSVTEAQRLITQGGVRLNGERVSDVRCELGSRAGEEALIQVGSRKFLRVVFK
ncbi:MAG TPA: tyrosine--tRNA ligase [Blastocatellia bacterium]|nr:tyrosine--tRNA ligase [Blastocatellia bacterium]